MSSSARSRSSGVGRTAGAAHLGVQPGTVDTALESTFSETKMQSNPSIGADLKLWASSPNEQLSPRREANSRLHSRNNFQKGLQEPPKWEEGEDQNIEDATFSGRTKAQRHTSLVYSLALLVLAGCVGWKLADYMNILPAGNDGIGTTAASSPATSVYRPAAAENDAAKPAEISITGGSSSNSAGEFDSRDQKQQNSKAPLLPQPPPPKMSPPSLTGSAVDPGFQSYFDEIAVVVVGGIGRQEHLAAAYSSWTSVFKNRILITDAPSSKHAGPSGMSNVLVNVYDGFETEADALREHTHPDHPIRKYLEHPEELATRKHFDKDMDAATRELFSSKHTLGWHLGQGKYLLGMELAQAKFPDAKWYIIADSDTMVFPERIVAGLHLQGRPDNVPVAIGAVYGAAKSALLPKFTSFLGGAGVLVNQAAMKKMNVSKCVDEQVANLGWSMAPADWRMGLCLNKYNVKKSNEKYMYQGNEQLNCLPHGGPPQECAWGGHYGNVMSDCPLTLHYQTPVHMQELFDVRTSVDNGGVCVPAPHWRDFTHECSCTNPAKALENGKGRPTKKGYQLPRGTHPTIGQLVDSTIAETVKGRQTEKGGAEQLKASVIKKQVEDIYRVMLFPQRKEIACVFETASNLYRSNMGMAASDHAAFRAAVIKELATNVKASVGRVQSWAQKQQV